MRATIKKRAKRVKGKDALFGIWKDNPKVRDVEAYVDNLRGNRHGDNRAIAKEALRQSRLAAKYERRQRPNKMRDKDIPGWK